MKNVLFLVGPHASGKTYSSKKVINEKGLKNVVMIDTGPIMRRLHKQQSPDTTIDVWVDELEKCYGPNITSDLITREINKLFVESGCDIAILIGFRTLKGILYTINNLDIDNYNILYADASFELLYKNFIARGEKQISKKEFEKYLEDELDSGLRIIKNMALNNNPYIDYYYRETNDDDFEEKICDLLEYEKKLIKRKDKK